MDIEIAAKNFQSDKQLLRNLLNSFGSVIVFVFYSDLNEESVQFMTNFNNSISIFGSFSQVKYFNVEASKCPQTLKKFNITSTPTVLLTQTDKKVLHLFQSPSDIGQIFDTLSLSIQKYRQQFVLDKSFWYPKIQSILQSCPVIIFIKGTPQNPKCGFTRTLLEILKQHKVQFVHYDIVQDQYMRYWLREYKQWETYPQIYVRGELIGGLDKVKELIAKGQFDKVIPQSSKQEAPQEKFNLMIKENDNIVFTNAFSFQSKETESFLKKTQQKHQDIYVCNVSLNQKLHEYIKNNLKQSLPFLVSKGEIYKQ